MRRIGLSLYLALAALTVALGNVAQASIVGMLSTPVGSGLVGGGNYAADEDGFQVAWDVAQNPDSTWHYNYTFTDLAGGDPRPGVSHIILQLSDNIAETDLFNFSIGIADSEFGEFGPHPSNPGFPAGESINGVKFNFDDDTVKISFDSTRQPMWADFYAKGGNDSFVYNRDLGINVANPDDYMGTAVDENGRPLFKILAPDTLIPEPTTATLMLAGFGLVGARKRR